MSSRKVRLLSVSAVILAICGISWFFLQGGSGPPPSPGSAQNQGREAPAFSLKDRLGTVHTLQEVRGKFAIVHFWAAWCPPCLQEIPELLEFAEHFRDDSRLKIIAISMDEKWEDAEKVLTTSKLPKNMISLLDSGDKVSDAYGTYQFPETYLVNPQGRIVAKWVGGQPWSSPKTIELMKKEVETAR